MSAQGSASSGRTQGVLWGYFVKREKQNTSQYRAHCLGCIEKARPKEIPIDIDGDILNSAAEEWFKEAVRKTAKNGSVLGVKKSMIAHVLACPNASEAAKKVAAREKGVAVAKEDAATDADDEAGQPSTKKRKVIEKTKQTLTQTQIKVVSGINIPFTAKQKALVEAQFGRATISANLPFRWVNDPEVIKLFLMFRATADNVIPDRRQLSGRILNDLSAAVDGKIKNVLNGAYTTISADGWDDNTRNKVTGVHAAAKGRMFLVRLMVTNRGRKDGEGMANAFEEIIDETEAETGCIVVLLCCDNDGGSKKGRNLVPSRRPWLLVAPCCGHQFNLILGDYFKESSDAADIAEQATAVIGWIQNHTKVRVVFDDVQNEETGRILAFIVANLTRWMTHFLSFNRLLTLKTSLRHAAILKRPEIIAAQIGAERRARQRAEHTETVNEYCDILESSEFWTGLVTVVEDIEPICYGTNINQSDTVRPDEVLLTFAGIWSHFHKHKDRRLSAAMKKRIEGRWKELDQPLFVFSLILNPFEGLTRFGDGAKVSPFTLGTEFLEFYRHIKSRPIPDLTEEAAASHRADNERQVSKAFYAYLSGSGSFQDWRDHQKLFEETHGPNPILVWEQFRMDSNTAELADFAIMLFELVVNQAGAERTFSDTAVKKTQRRNRLKIPRLEKMSKAGADMRREHVEAGIVQRRKPRANYDSDKMESLLQVPKHPDLLDSLEDVEDSESDPEHVQRPVLVRSRNDWRRAMKTWIQAEREVIDDDVEMEEDPERQSAGAGQSSGA